MLKIIQEFRSANPAQFNGECAAAAAVIFIVPLIGAILMAAIPG